MIRCLTLILIFFSHTSLAGKARIIEPTSTMFFCNSSCVIDESSIPQFKKEISDKDITLLQCTRKGFKTRSLIIDNKKILLLDRKEYSIVINSVEAIWKIDKIIIVNKNESNNKLILNRETLKIEGQKLQCKKVSVDELINPYLDTIKSFKKKNKI